MTQQRAETGEPLSRDVGWVLSNARKHGGGDGRVAAARLAAAMEPPVHRSQVGRWESGRSGITWSQVRRYERELGLPEGQLSTAMDLLARMRERVQASPHLVAQRVETWWADTDTMLDKALSDERMTGLEWSRLSTNLSLDSAAFVRHRDWVRVIRRCVLESAYCIGLEYLLRDEALGRFVAHPRSVQAIETVLDETLSNPSALYRESVMLAINATGSTGVDVLLRHLADPVNESATWALLWSTRQILRSGRLTPEQTAFVGARAVSWLETDAPSDRVRRQAATLIDAVEGPERERVVRMLSTTGRARLAHLVEAGSVLAGTEVEALRAEIAARLFSSFGPETSVPPTLRRLLETVTSRSSLDERGDALSVLMLSPQGAVVGRTYAAALRWALAEGHEAVVSEALVVLSWLIQPEDVELLLGLAADRRTEPVIALLALQALGNCPVVPAGQGDPPSRSEVAERVYREALGQLRVPGGDAAMAARGHLYVLGMYGRFDLIEKLAVATRDVEGDHADVWCRATTVWLDLPKWARPLVR